MRIPHALLAAALLLGAGCATLDEDLSGASAERLYQAAKESLDSGYFEAAIKQFEELESRYPFGAHAQQAQLEKAYAYYRFDEPESAIAAAEHFIKTYPRHPNVDYAYYIRGLANFSRTSEYLDKPLKRDPAHRDPRSAHESFKYFAELVERFPDSRYAADAVQRMVYLNNYLARHEIYVADYYMQRGAYIAAVNRAQFVLENYSRTPSVPDALLIMADAYRQLGLAALADDAERVLELNHPGYRAARAARAPEFSDE